MLARRFLLCRLTVVNIQSQEYLDAYSAKLAEVKFNNDNALIKKIKPRIYDEADDELFDNLISNEAVEPGIVRHATKRKRWGIEKGHKREYWYNPVIHTFGNTGLFGGFHAICAPIATYIIDKAAYEGRNIREDIAGELKKVVGKNPSILDMCCGVGMSTRALAAKFHDAETIIGLDTSPEMISMAEFQSVVSKVKSSVSEVKDSSIERISEYVQGNAEKTDFPGKSFDLVTIMYAFHEAPKMGRDMILREVRRLLKPGGKLALIDISPEYTPR